jgi:hypothetical protein
MSKLFFIVLVFLLTGIARESLCLAGFYYAADPKKPSLTQACSSKNQEKTCQKKPLSHCPYDKKRKVPEKIKPILPSLSVPSLPKTKPINIFPDVKEIILPSSPTFQPPIPMKSNTGSGLTQTALPQWKAPKGSTLRHVLEQWTGKARVDLEWGAEFDYPLLTSFDISGTFEEALKKLLDAFSESNPCPYGRLHQNGAHSILVIQTRGKTHYDS